MIVDSLKTSYLCSECESSLEINSVGAEFHIDDLYKHIGMAQCSNCNSIGTVDATHIKCVLSTKPAFNYQYILRCDICNASWATKCVIGGKFGLMQIKRRIEGVASCVNPTCASRSFSLIAHNRIKD